MRKHLPTAALTVGLFIGFTSASTEASLARPPVVQRDLNQREVVDVSADGHFALTAAVGTMKATKLVDLTTNARQSWTFEANHAHLTDDGSSMVFQSAQRLIAADKDNKSDVYRYRFATKAFTRFSLAGRSSDGMLLEDIDGDGSVLAFNDSGYLPWALIFDTASKTWRSPNAAVSADDYMVPLNQPIRLSRNGQRAAWMRNDTGGVLTNVYVYDWPSNTARAVSMRYNGRTLDSSSGYPSISPDGNIVSFTSDAANVVAGYSTPRERVYVRNMTTHVTKMISDKPSNLFDAVNFPALVDNGKALVVFESRPTRIGTATSNKPQPILYDIATRSSVMLDKPAGTALPNNVSTGVATASAAKRVVFTSKASNFTTVLPASTVVSRVYMSTLP